MIYSFIILNNNLKNDKNKTDIWNEIISFFNIFLESKSPSTIFWVYEILNLILIKVPIKDSSNKNLRNTLVDISSRVFLSVLKFANNNFEILFEEGTQLITPLSPSVYELIVLENYSQNFVKVNDQMFEELSKEKVNFIFDEKKQNKLSDENVKGFYMTLYEYVISRAVIKNDDLLTVYRKIGFIILKNLFYNTMKNIYLLDKNEKLFLHVK